MSKKEIFAELAKSGRAGYSVIDTALDKIAELEQQLAATTADLETERRLSFRNQVAELEQQLAAEQEKVKRLRHKYEETVGSFKRDLQEKLDDQRSKSSRLEKQLATVSAERTAFQDQCIRLKRQLAQRDAQLLKNADILGEAADALDHKDTQIKMLRDALKEWQKAEGDYGLRQADIAISKALIATEPK